MVTVRLSDRLIAIWSFCEPEDREAFVSYLAISGYLNNANSAVEVGAPVSPEGATQSKPCLGHATDCSSLAAREVDESAATISPSAATPVEAVAVPQAPRPSATAEVSHPQEPTSSPVTADSPAHSSSHASGALHCPANPAVADGQPSIPTSDVLAAGQGAMPGSIAKSGDAVTTSKPGCLSPDNCRIKFQTTALCWKCRDAQSKARAA